MTSFEPKLLIAIIGITIITTAFLLLSQEPPEPEENIFNFKAYYLYHFEDEFDPSYEILIQNATTNASNFISTYDGRTYEVDIEAVKIDSVEFGREEHLLNRWFFDRDLLRQETQKIWCELSQKTDLDQTYDNYYRVWLIFEGTGGGAFGHFDNTIFTKVPIESPDAGKVIVHEQLHFYDCEHQDPRDPTCFMDNGSIDVLNDETLCGCAPLDEELYRKISLIILKGTAC